MDDIEKPTGFFPVATVLFCLAVIGAYMSLMPIGHWQTDEYATLRAIKLNGTEFLRERLATWSPRPFSELLIYLYAKAVETWSGQLIGPVLAPVWGMLLICAIAPAAIAWKRHGVNLVFALIVPLSLLCMFLLGHPVSEIFYWPMGALAYIPTLAAIVLIHGLTETTSRGIRGTRLVIMLALIVASTSSEVGAMFVMAYSCATLLCLLPHGERRRWKAMLVDLFIPLVVSALVLYRVVTGRVALNAETFGDAQYIHQLVPSAIGAMPHALWELVSSDGTHIDARHLLSGMMTKAAFFAGVFTIARVVTQGSGSQQLRLPLIVATFALVPITLFTAYYQFGMMACCERHATFRQCMVFIGLASSASALAALAPSVRLLARLPASRAQGAGFILLALLIGATSSIRGLWHDYANYNTLASAHEATWASGRAHGPTMTVTQSAYGSIVGGYPILPARTYTKAEGEVSEAITILDYFTKQRADFTQPHP
jgi:hypothetical protein